MTADITIRSAWISECGALRWTLRRHWGSDQADTVLFIGLNPSTADAQIDDPTVRRWIHFARSWGFGGFTAVNLYPLRTPHPRDLAEWARWEDNGPDWWTRDRLFDNLDIIAREAQRAALVVPCWGALPAWARNWAEHVTDRVAEEATVGEIHCLGTSAGDDPIHPMARGRNRIPDDRQPIVWRSM